MIPDFIVGLPRRMATALDVVITVSISVSSDGD